IGYVLIALGGHVPKDTIGEPVVVADDGRPASRHDGVQWSKLIDHPDANVTGAGRDGLRVWAGTVGLENERGVILQDQHHVDAVLVGTALQSLEQRAGDVDLVRAASLVEIA